MHLTHVQPVVAAVSWAGVSLLGVAPAVDPVEFRPHVIEPTIPGGYAVLAVDMNKDGRLDVIGNSLRVQELAWHENPTWERHVMVEGLPGMVNLAAADLDGDGIPEIALESAFAAEGLKSLTTAVRREAGSWQATALIRDHFALAATTSSSLRCGALTRGKLPSSWLREFALTMVSVSLESQRMELTRITVDPEVMGGRPCIRGMRVTVGMLLGLLASGKSAGDILGAYPYLEEEDIREALAYAAWRAEEIEVPLGRR